MGSDVLDVTEWIKYAQEDYDYAVETAKTNNPYAARHVCFNCQQSAEKILKAYVIAKEGTRAKIHDLVKLLKQCEQHHFDFGNFATACSALNMYIVVSRYPSGMNLTKQHMQQALKDAAEILEFTKIKLKEMGYGYEPEQT